MDRKRRKKKDINVEELYQNKNFVPPKEKHLETIFEEPRKTKDGAEMLTSIRKFKRYLHFDTTKGKIQKRKLKARKCSKKLKTNQSKTRSKTKLKESVDVHLYISNALGEEISDELSSKEAVENETVTESLKNKESDEREVQDSSDINQSKYPDFDSAPQVNTDNNVSKILSDTHFPLDSTVQLMNEESPRLSCTVT